MSTSSKVILTLLPLLMMAFSAKASAKNCDGEDRENLIKIVGEDVACEMSDDEVAEVTERLNDAINSESNNDSYDWDGDRHRGRIVFVDQAYFGPNYYYCRQYQHQIWGSHGFNVYQTGWICSQDMNSRWSMSYGRLPIGWSRFDRDPFDRFNQDPFGRFNRDPFHDRFGSGSGIYFGNDIGRNLRRGGHMPRQPRPPRRHKKRRK